MHCIVAPGSPSVSCILYFAQPHRLFIADTNMGCSESKADSGASSGNKPDQKQPEKPDSNGQQQQQDAGEGNQQQQQAT